MSRRILFVAAISLFSGSIVAGDEPPQPKTTKPAPPKRLVLPGDNFIVADRPAFAFLPPEEKRRQPQPWIFYAPTLPAYPDEAERWMHEQNVLPKTASKRPMS
jgi:hypothetical protein